MNPLELNEMREIEGLLGVAFVVHSRIQRTAFEILYRMEDAFWWISQLFMDGR